MEHGVEMTLMSWWITSGSDHDWRLTYGDAHAFMTLSKHINWSHKASGDPLDPRVRLPRRCSRWMLSSMRPVSRSLVRTTSSLRSQRLGPRLKCLNSSDPRGGHGRTTPQPAGLSSGVQGVDVGSTAKTDQTKQ